MEDVPIVIGNEKIKTENVRYQVMVRKLIVDLYLLLFEVLN